MNEQGMKLDALSVGYDKRIIVKDVSLQIKHGQILTLIGPNGSGKSTILKTIVSQLKPLGGCMYYNDENMKNMNLTKRAQMMAILMTERVNPELATCREVVATGRYPYTGRMGRLSDHDWEMVDEALELVCAVEQKDLLFSQISDGQRQRIMLARAICQEPKVLILDEPTSFLDMKYKLEILGKLRLMTRTRNMAVILSLHEIDLAIKISDQIASVSHGVIERYGTCEEILKDDYISKLYGIHPDAFNSYTGEIYFANGGMNQQDEMGEMDGSGIQNTPEVFVIGGGGAGILVYNRLYREGISFIAGIISKSDVEYQAAKALACEVLETQNFEPPSAEVIEQAKKWIQACNRCEIAVEHFGIFNQYNQELAEYAKKLDKIKV